jgi:hypothetical protein
VNHQTPFGARPFPPDPAAPRLNRVRDGRDCQPFGAREVRDCQPFAESCNLLGRDLLEYPVEAYRSAEGRGLEAELRKRVLGACVLAAAMLFVLPSLAAAANSSGIEHLKYSAGPYTVTPGANLILTQYNKVPKPKVDGFMIRMSPNLRYALPNGKCCGKVPQTKDVHLHHGVWLSDGAAGEGEGNGHGLYPFMASGEEKTQIEFPPGYGYPVAAKDHWILNYMIHNLTDKQYKVYITYDLEFVPATSPLAASITPAHPIWMDVQDHHVYPVFDVKKGSGKGGKFTYPNMARAPYGSGAALNKFTVTHAGTLIGTAGHLHPGGLYTELDLTRPGVRPAGNFLPGLTASSVRLFRSWAHYFDKRGPVSWDVAMSATNTDWRPAVKPGDVLSVSATYDSKIASWYEVMGIMVVWEAWNDPHRGLNPLTHVLDQKGHLTHGHLAENSYYGGSAFIGVNPMAWAECARSRVEILGFRYLPGDFTSHGSQRCIPTVAKGHSIDFVNKDAQAGGTFNPINPNPFYIASVFHTITSCKNPCNLNYGIAYPLAGGRARFDSGELGAGTPGVGRLDWSTPTNLAPGTYTFFCRIHPWMRGVFRVIK